MKKTPKTKQRKVKRILPPYSQAELKRNLKPVKARIKLDSSSLDQKLLLGRLNIPENLISKICLDVSGVSGQLDLKLKLPEFGAYDFPKNIESTFIKKDEFVIDPDTFVELGGYRPQHLSLNTSPAGLPRQFETRKNYFETFPKRKGVGYATTIFGADNRRLFLDSSYPWGTVGLVSTPIGSGSGVMVGPRHLLTVSHVIQWTGDGAGWVNFTPGSFDGFGPFGSAWGTRVYFRLKVKGPSLDRNEMQHDYAVVVLDRRIGDITGWMGTKSWSDDWDDESYWSHVGYPGDLNSGTRPSFQNNISMDGSFWDRERHTRIFHKGDVFPGQSGGPFFAWWANGPHAVAVQSAQNSDENTASGGSEMVDLVIRARNEHP